MLIFNKTDNKDKVNTDIKTEETEVIKENEIEFDEFFCSDEYVDDTLMEMARIGYQLESGLLIADLKAEEIVFEGADTPEAVMEAVGEGFFKSILDGISKITNMILNFIKGVLKMIAQKFAYGKKFADTYGADIREKSAPGFEITGYDYDLAAGYAIVTAVEKGITVQTGDAIDTLKAQVKEKLGAEKGQYTADDLYKKIGHGDNATEVAANLKKAYRNGKADESKYAMESANFGKGQMLDFISSTKAYSKPVEDNKALATKTYNEFIAAVNSLKSEYKSLGDVEKKRCIANVQEMAKFHRAESTLLLTVCRVQSNMYREIDSHCHSALKKYLSYKPADMKKEEPATPKAESAQKGIFEQAMELV